MQVGTLIVLQGTPFCNIDCAYCYLPDRSNRKQMPKEIARHVFRRSLESQRVTDPITFLWHAGEPLTVAANSYAELFDTAREDNQSFGRDFSFSIQTNGTLINNKWVKLFQRYNVRVGVSIDGPEFVHDRQRTDRAGRGTHAQTLRGLKHLQDAGLDPPVIAVLSDFSLDHADEIFDFFETNGISDIGLNVEALSGTHANTTVKSYERVVAFFQRIMERLRASEATFSVREVRLVYGAFRNLKTITRDGHNGRNSTTTPFDIITVDRTGDYSTFCPELRGAPAKPYSNFVMGNVQSDPFDEMVGNPVFKTMDEEIRRGIARCQQDCAYWFSCFGGTPSSKFFEQGRFDIAETENCRYQRQAVVEALLKHIQDHRSGSVP